MEKKDLFSKSLVIAGTILVWFPIAAPFLLGFVSLDMDGVYRFDPLMIAEFWGVAITGGIMLLWAANRTRFRRKIIAWGLGISAGAMAIVTAIGGVEIGSLEWMLAIGLLVIYSMAIILMGIGGVLLWRDLFRK